MLSLLRKTYSETKTEYRIKNAPGLLTCVLVFL